VPDNGLGIGVLVVRIGIKNTFVHQVAEATFTEQVCIPVGQIAAQGVDGNLQHKPRWFLRACRGP
jgi:hypothetical protein